MDIKLNVFLLICLCITLGTHARPPNTAKELVEFLRSKNIKAFVLDKEPTYNEIDDVKDHEEDDVDKVSARNIDLQQIFDSLWNKQHNNQQTYPTSSSTVTTPSTLTSTALPTPIVSTTIPGQPTGLSSTITTGRGRQTNETPKTPSRRRPTRRRPARRRPARRRPARRRPAQKRPVDGQKKRRRFVRRPNRKATKQPGRRGTKRRRVQNRQTI